MAETIRRIYYDMEGILRAWTMRLASSAFWGRRRQYNMDALRDYCLTPPHVWETERDRINGFSSLALQSARSLQERRGTGS
jgi:hypothetical protein